MEEHEIEQFLEEESEIEGSSGEKEEIADDCINSNHDNHSEIGVNYDSEESEIEDGLNIIEMNETSEDYFISQHKNPPILKWQKSPPNKTIGTKTHNIISYIPNVEQTARSVKSPLECFSLFFDEEVLNLLVSSTNLYIEKIRIKFKRERDIKNVTTDEMKAFIGLLIMAGIIRTSFLDYLDLWAVNGTCPEIFQLTMTYKRFLFFLRCLRFDDIRTRNERTEMDHLAAIRELSIMLEDKFQKAYSLGRHVSIDESLVGFRGKFKGNVYMPNKPNKYGIKIYTMVDADTFYLHSFEIDEGNQTGPCNLFNRPDEIVKRLVNKIKGSGRNIIINDRYTSCQLALDLMESEFKLSLVGTLNKNKPDIPKEFLPHKKRPQSSSLFGFTKNMTMVSYVPKKNKADILLSTMHNDTAIDQYSGNQCQPKIVTFYNLKKGGVDKLDRLCATYNVARRTRRWPLAIFFHLVNTAALNAYIIHKTNNEKCETHIRRKFLRTLAVQLVEPLQQARLQVKATPKQIKKKIKLMHGTVAIPLSNSRGRCHLCSRKNDQKHSLRCSKCQHFVCREHSTSLCTECNDSDSSE